MKPNRRFLIFLTLLMMIFSLSVVMPTSVSAAKKKGKKAAPAKKKKKRALDPKSKKSLIYLDTAGSLAGTGDAKKSGMASVMIQAGAGWHPAALAETGLPVDKYGLVDWVKVVQDKWIEPRWSENENADPDDEELLDVDILFEALGDFTDDVVFPHAVHTWWLKCEICHDSVGGPMFNPEAGSNKVLMVDMVSGKWCGRCHDRVAFPLTDCKRCHTRPKGAKPDDSLVVREKNY